MFSYVLYTIIYLCELGGEKMRKNIRFLIILLCISIVMTFVGCGSKSSSKSEKKVTLTISAAASLKDAMGEIKKQYAKEEPNVTINYNFAGSGVLQQQIEQGANVDIFMSAAKKQMDALSQKGLLIENTKENLIGNTVVLVVKKDNSGVTDFRDSEADKIKKIALGEPKTVPCGQYAEEIYTKLNVLDKVKAKAVYGKDVTEVLTWVETGNVDAGVVYATDAKSSTKVKVAAVATKDMYNTPVVYPAAVIKSSKNVDAAKEFLKYLSQKNSKATFEKYGFDFLLK